MLMGLRLDSARETWQELKLAGYRLALDPTCGEALPTALDCEYGSVYPKAFNGMLLDIMDHNQESA